MIKVYDDYLDKKNLDKIIETINSPFFPFYYCERIVRNTDDPYQFYHRLIGIENYDSSIPIRENQFTISNEMHNFKSLFYDLRKNFDVSIFMRATINFLVPHPEFKKQHHTPHIDIDDTPHEVFLLYLNDSDGDTFFFENNKISQTISPKRNRLVLFDGSILHSSSSPVKNNKRQVINIDFQR